MITKIININITWDTPCRGYLLGFIDGWCFTEPSVSAEDGFGGDLSIIVEGNIPIEKLVGIFDEAGIDFDKDVSVNYYVDNLNGAGDYIDKCVKVLEEFVTTNFHYYISNENYFEVGLPFSEVKAIETILEKFLK